MIRVIVADDHPVVRNGLLRVLADQPDIEVVGEARDAEELTGVLNTQSCDVLTLDISMPGRNGLDALKEIKTNRAGLAVLVLTIYGGEHQAVRAFRAGADGYLTKDSPPTELLDAIRRLADGGTYMPPALADKMVASLQRGTVDPHDKLSGREFEVLRRLASGSTIAQIAAELFVSRHTISTYRARLLEKLHLRTTVELIHYAITRKLVDDSRHAPPHSG
jgi:DNA-binding NarL/FixJ family response regulator